jgi:hypothetical protein
MGRPAERLFPGPGLNGRSSPSFSLDRAPHRLDRLSSAREPQGRDPQHPTPRTYSALGRVGGGPMAPPKLSLKVNSTDR